LTCQAPLNTERNAALTATARTSTATLETAGRQPGRKTTRGRAPGAATRESVKRNPNAFESKSGLRRRRRCGSRRAQGSGPLDDVEGDGRRDAEALVRVAEVGGVLPAQARVAVQAQRLTGGELAPRAGPVAFQVANGPGVVGHVQRHVVAERGRRIAATRLEEGEP